MPMMTKEDYESMSPRAKAQMAGFVGLLADNAVHLSGMMESEEQWDLTAEAIGDYCELTGAKMKVVLRRIEVILPKEGD